MLPWASATSFDTPCLHRDSQVMQKAGNMQAMLKQGPFGSGPEAAAQLAEGEKKLNRYAQFVEVRVTHDRARKRAGKRDVAK